MKNTKMNIENEQNNLFPITYEGKEYYENDCDDVFLSFYHFPEVLNTECGVFMAGGLWVYPDGKMEEY